MTDLEVELVDEWDGVLTALHARFASRFARPEPRRRALAYMRGLLAPLERKNGWTLAEQAGDRLPAGMQRLLAEADWDADKVRDDVRAFVVDSIGDRNAILIGADTSFVKKGTRSAGVQQQLSGAAGRIMNCQVGTFLAYAAPKGQALIDRELYLPPEWTEDRERCRRAGIGDGIAFATKTKQFKTMLSRALEARIPFTWVTADETYGRSKSLRSWLERHGVAHVMQVKSNDTVITRTGEIVRVRSLIADLAPQAWKRLPLAKGGAHGECLYHWARAAIYPLWGNHHEHWLLACRSLTEPTKTATYLCYGPVGTPLKVLARVASAGWAVEDCFQTAKSRCGLDHYQVRRYQAWYRHITLAMAALAALSDVRADGNLAQKAPQWLESALAKEAPPHRLMLATPPSATALATLSKTQDDRPVSMAKADTRHAAIGDLVTTLT